MISEAASAGPSNRDDRLEVEDLTDTLGKATSAGANILVPPIQTRSTESSHGASSWRLYHRDPRPADVGRGMEITCGFWGVLLLLLFVEVWPVRAQPCWSPGPVAPDRTYQLLAGDEDWSFLRDPALRKDFWDPIKYIRLRDHRDDWYLSIGGETRQDFERIATITGGRTLSRTLSFFSAIWCTSMSTTANTFVRLFS
jgi:hypothetical protein